MEETAGAAGSCRGTRRLRPPDPSRRAPAAGLTGVDPTDPDNTGTAVLTVVQHLRRDVEYPGGVEDALYGALLLSNTLVEVLALAKDVDRLDVIASLREAFTTNDPRRGLAR